MLSTETSRKTYHGNGNIHEVFWVVNGRKHREDGPAHIEYHENGKVKRMRWFDRGVLLRDYCYDENGLVVKPHGR